jgi:hypothetical protein
MKMLTNINKRKPTHKIPQDRTTIKAAAATLEEEAVAETDVVEAKDKARMDKEEFRATILAHCLAMLATHGASVGLTDTGTASRLDAQPATSIQADVVAQTEMPTQPNYLFRRLTPRVVKSI